MSTPESPASLPSIHFEQFDGPLDLLLDEVRRQNVAIEKIAMAPIVARYLEYMRNAADRNLNLDIEWLQMAATLIHWKSRALLPQNPDASGDQDSIRDDLVQQLLARKTQLTNELARRRSLEEAQLSRRSGSEVAGEIPNPEIVEPTFVSVWDLMQQARDLATWVAQRRGDRQHWIRSFDVKPDEPGVEDMIQYLRGCLSSRGGSVETIALLENQRPAHRPSLFLAVLELAREVGIQLQQNESFGPIWLRDLRTGLK